MTLFPSHNDKILSRYNTIIPLIRRHLETYSTWEQEKLQRESQELHIIVTEDTFSNVKKNEDVVAKALALAGVASQRVLGLKPFDVQYIGALTLLEGKIAQMRTGEGKTLTAALACFARSLEGKGVHVVTVNEYLARRDSHTMGRVFTYLGKTTGLIYPNQPREEKQKAYQADITYATNSELGFDFLRNNMALGQETTFMREMHFAVVDEVDSILIDEARTPLVISANDKEKDHLFYQIDELASQLVAGENIDDGNIVEAARRISEDSQATSSGSVFDKIVGANNKENGDYIVEKKRRQIHMTEQGFLKAEELFIKMGILAEDDSLYATHNLSFLYYLEAALKARNLFRKNIEYIVKDDNVHIVDEFTGRILPGRRWGYGIHQAIEAKERVSVREETRTIASITLQNLFREYKTLSGMTGTAKTEEDEFWDIYGLEVIVIPTHKPMIREDAPDLVFLSIAGKTRAILNDIIERHKNGQPLLVGTTSVKASEEISHLLNNEGIPHQVLNANNHEQESHIIAQAGKKNSVTIATNMAGRGTDIVLGGLPESDNPQAQTVWEQEHKEVIELGGLHVIGTERHESRRIDDQLRGRAGRQGDPGSSQFYVSFDDELMRLFGTGWAKKTLQVIGMDESRALASPMVSKQIEKAQKAVEKHNYTLRKELLDYDDVGNEQRKQLYAWRNWLLDTKDQQHQKTYFLDVVFDEIASAVEGVAPLLVRDEEAFWARIDEISSLFSFDRYVIDTLKEKWKQNTSISEIKKDMWEIASSKLHVEDPTWLKESISLALKQTDEQWHGHLAALDFLRKGIHLRGYAQKQPKQEYKIEAYNIFEQMVKSSQGALAVALLKKEAPNNNFNSWEFFPVPPFAHKQDFTTYDISARNALCSCGSGKHYKSCCGVLSDENKPLYSNVDASSLSKKYSSLYFWQGRAIPSQAFFFGAPAPVKKGQATPKQRVQQEIKKQDKSRTWARRSA